MDCGDGRERIGETRDQSVPFKEALRKRIQGGVVIAAYSAILKITLLSLL